MTTQTVETLIETQNKVTRFAAKARDLQREIKYCEQDLKKLANGFYEQCLRNDPEFVTRNTKRQTDERDFKSGQLSVYLEQLAALEATRPAHLPHTRLLAYFKGNNLEAARSALELLDLCIAADQWLPNCSKRIQAGLNVAKIAVERGASKEQTKAGFIAEFTPVQALITRWNGLRPKPTFTSLGASATVTATLKSLGATAVSVAEIIYEEVQLLNVKTGKVETRYIGRVVFPEGCRHGCSRYQGTNDNRQCEACGHAIKNPFNWCPLVLTTAEGPKSLWTGRDCAKTLFGIDMTGELELAPGQR